MLASSLWWKCVSVDSLAKTLLWRSCWSTSLAPTWAERGERGEGGRRREKDEEEDKRQDKYEEEENWKRMSCWWNPNDKYENKDEDKAKDEQEDKDTDDVEAKLQT